MKKMGENSKFLPEDTSSQSSGKSGFSYTFEMVLDKCEMTLLFIRVHSKTAKCFVETGRHGFCGFILKNPAAIATVSGLLCLIMTVVAFALHPPDLKTNTDEAFKTWGTHISGALNTWQSIDSQLTQNLYDLKLSINDSRHFQKSQASSKHEAECSKMVTVVLKAPSMTELSEGNSMKELCKIHRLLTDLMNRTIPTCGGELIQPISYYSAMHCQQAMTASCDDVFQTREQQIMPDFMGLGMGAGIMDMNCMGLVETSLKKIFGQDATINSALLSKGAKELKNRYNEIYTAIHVPTSNESQLSELAYEKLKILKLEWIKFQGIYVDDKTRTKLLEKIIKMDLLSLVPICSGLILLLMWFYTGSLLYTLAALEMLLFAFGVSYFVYFFVYCMEPFWFTNYLSAVILLGIGADDCFVLFHSLKGEHRSTKLMNTFGDSDVTTSAFAQASLAMFVTSLTTAIAFLTNMITDVIAIKAFGIFAATLVMINYLLVVSFLPACLMVNNKHWHPMVQKITGFTTEKLRNFFQRYSDRTFTEFLPMVIDKIKGLLVFMMLFGLVGSAVITFHHPKLPLAHNSSKLFHKDHQIQWFLDNFVDTFDLKQPPVTETIHAIWGLRPVDTSSRYHRDWPSEIETDKYFTVSPVFLEKQRVLCGILNKNGFESDCFAEKFAPYLASHCTVGDDVELLEKCIKRYLKSVASNTSLSDHAMRNGPLFHKETHHIQGYILNFLAKFPSVSIDCRYVDKARHNVNNTFQNAASILNQSELSKGWIVPSSNIASRILYKCDLKQVLQKSTLVSVLAALSIALAVVILVTRNVKLGVASMFVILTIILVTTACLVLLKWELNIVESIIITLGVGLSFDFTLHYAVAYRAHGSQCKNSRAKISAMLDEAGVPVFLSALSTLIAGFIFSFAEAYPFYQVGIFMCLITLCSWIGSTFFFPSFITFIDECIDVFSKENLEKNFVDETSLTKSKMATHSGMDPLDACQLQSLLQ